MEETEAGSFVRVDLRTLLDLRPEPVQIGPYEVTGDSHMRHALLENGPFIELRVTRDNTTSVVRVDNGDFRNLSDTKRLRVGMTAVVDGMPTTMERNGPRPFSAYRRITIIGSLGRWEARGRWTLGTELVDADGRRLFRSRLGSCHVVDDLPADQAALLLLLVARGVPQSLSLSNSNWLP